MNDTITYVGFDVHIETIKKLKSAWLAGHLRWTFGETLRRSLNSNV